MHAESLEGEGAGHVDRDVTREVQEIDAILDAERLRAGGQDWADESEGDTLSEGLHAANPGGDSLKEFRRNNRFDFPQYKHPLLPGFELELDVKAPGGLCFDPTDANAREASDGDLIP